jgi:hypothetical protein
MISNFVKSMSANDRPYDALRFLASDFFRGYWKYFSCGDISEEYSQIVQSAARECNDYFMDDESIFWNISFSTHDTAKTWNLYQQRTSKLPEKILDAAHSLIVQISVSADESTNADYLLNLMTRIRADEFFREEVDITHEDAEILDCVYEINTEPYLDLYEVRQKWLLPQSNWDEKLKAQTPDLPESLAVIFSMAYEPRTNLPIIKTNLLQILESREQYDQFVQRLEKAFYRSRSEVLAVQFPELMKL